jgi:hypothetical protein
MSVATKLMYKKSTKTSLIEVEVSFPLQHQLILIVTKLCTKHFHRNISVLGRSVASNFFSASDALILALA